MADLDDRSERTPPPEAEVGIALDAAADGELSPLRHLLRIGHRYRTVIIVCWLAAVVLSLPFAALAPKKYTATGLITFDGMLATVGTPATEFVKNHYNSEFFAKNQMGLLESYDLADFVLSAPENADIRQALEKRIDRDPESSGQRLGYRQPYTLLERYVKRVENLRIPTTLTVKIWASAPDPILAARMVNAHGEAFVKIVKERERRVLVTAADDLERQAAGLRPAIDRTVAEVNELVRQSPTPEIIGSGLISRLNPPLLTHYLFQEYANTFSERSELEVSGTKGGDSSRIRLFDTPNLYNSLFKLSELEAEYEALAQRLAPRHPELRKLQARIAALQKSVQEQRAERLDDLKADTSAKKLSESIILETLEQSRKELVDGLEVQLKADGPVQQYQQLRELERDLTEAAKGFRLLSERDLLRVELSNRAVPPSTSSGVPGAVFLLIGCFFGPIVGSGIALILHAADQSIESAETLQLLGLHFLGQLPQIDASRIAAMQAPEDGPRVSVPGETDGPAQTDRREQPTEITTMSPDDFGVTRSWTNIISRSPWGGRLFKTSVSNTMGLRIRMLADPSSPFTEAIRTIRTELASGARSNKARAILVTSPSRGEGKSTVAIGLACSFAQIGFKTLLIDANLRTPAVHTTLGLSTSQPGLAEYLSGRATHEQIVLRTKFQDLHAITAAVSFESPVDLLSNRRFEELLELAADNYHYIVVDAPALLTLGDARVVARLVDEAVLVARYRETERPALKRSMNVLRTLGTPVSGCVLNGVDPEENPEVEQK
jgi:capsular exopolysaccharide synthesis family protein